MDFARADHTLQLLEVIEHWSNIIDNGNSVDVIYLDFKKHLILCLIIK